MLPYVLVVVEALIPDVIINFPARINNSGAAVGVFYVGNSVLFAVQCSLWLAFCGAIIYYDAVIVGSLKIYFV